MGELSAAMEIFSTMAPTCHNVYESSSPSRCCTSTSNDEPAHSPGAGRTSVWSANIRRIGNPNIRRAGSADVQIIRCYPHWYLDFCPGDPMRSTNLSRINVRSVFLQADWLWTDCKLFLSVCVHMCVCGFAHAFSTF